MRDWELWAENGTLWYSRELMSHVFLDNVNILITIFYDISSYSIRIALFVSGISFRLSADAKKQKVAVTRWS